VDGPDQDPTWDAALRAPDHLVGGSAPGLAARLDRWLADARVDGSADSRAKERWLRQAADADATFSGMLLDLAERGVGVVVATVAGRRHHGAVVVLGADFVSLRGPTAAEVVLSMRAIASVRTAPAVAPAAGERVATTDLCLGDVLGGLAAERARVRLVVRDASEAVSGELRSMGQDVVTLRSDTEAGGTAYVPLDAVIEVSLG
jgi:hypothetical protein